MGLDATTPEGDSTLRGLIYDAVDAYQEGHRRGTETHSLADPDRLVERAHHNLARYGPLTELLDDPDVWEIMVNSPTAIFAKRHTGHTGRHTEVFHDDEHVIRTITKLLDDSGTSHRKLDPSEGLQDAQLDDGARVHIVHGDLTRGGHLQVNIRKFTGVSISNLDELVARGSLTIEAARFLAAAVRAHTSIVFAGAPGSGKTTLLSCCAAELDPSLRVVIAEEVFEADIPVANLAGLQTRPARNDRPEIDLRRLVAGFLRMAPDVAIVGEVRDHEALPLLLTLSSGVTGYTTIHAGSARNALTRLRFVAQLSEAARDLPLSALNALVSDSVDLVVHTERAREGPRVTSILAVEDLTAGSEAVNLTTTEVFTRNGQGFIEWTGLVPSRLRDRMSAHGEDLTSLLDPTGFEGPRSTHDGLDHTGPHSRAAALCDDDAGRRAVMSIAFGLIAALGAYLLIPRKSGGSARSELLRHFSLTALSERLRGWLVRTGLGDVSPLQFIAVSLGFGFAAGGLWSLLVGVGIPGIVVGALAACVPTTLWRRRHGAARAATLESWPRMIEEIRVRVGSVGQSIPQALLESGMGSPEPIRSAFVAAQREWALTTDFERTVVVLKDSLADPTADVVCETLLVTQQVGGDLDARLEALAADRRTDLRERSEADARSAGARLARWFVIIVPAGMAFAGLNLGDGRAAYAGAGGQVATVIAITMVVACWWWAGRIMATPPQRRVFDR